MKVKLRISNRAVRDIESILQHTRENFGARQRDEYASLIRAALKDIAADPCGAPAKRRPEFHPDVRTLHIARRGRRARHFFLYPVRGSGFVDIGRLLHDSMDLEKHLPEGFEADG